MAGNSEKEPLYEGNQDEHFYEAADTNSPVYDNLANNQKTESMSEEELAEHNRQQEEWKAELMKLEDEISTLRQVLGTKIQQANGLKRQLGITPLQELTTDFKKSVQTIKDSGAYKNTSEKLTQLNEKITSNTAYQRTSEKITELNEMVTHTGAYQKTSATLKTVGQKTGAVVSSVGAFASRKYGDMRNSQAYKSFEERVGGAVSNVKAKVSGSKSEHSFEEALNSTTGADRDETVSPTTPAPEEKVPL